jgi:hypothetical protein
MWQASCRYQTCLVSWQPPYLASGRVHSTESTADRLTLSLKMAKTVIVNEDFEEPKRWWLHPVLWLTIGSCLYFTLFWFVIWPVVIDQCKGFYPESKGWAIFLWITALVVWSVPLCCIVCCCVFRERRRIDAKMEVRRRQLAKSCGVFFGVPLRTNAVAVQPDARQLRSDSPRGLIFPSVIVEEEDDEDVSLPPSPIMQKQQPRDASTQALYTGSSKRVSLMDRGSNESSILRSEDVEEALKKLSQSTNEDDVFARGTVATKRTYVQPPEIFVQSSSSVGSGQKKGSWSSSYSSESSEDRPIVDVIKEFDAVVQSGQDGELQSEEFTVDEEEDDVFPAVTVEQGANEKSKVLVKQTSQSEFFVGNGYRKQSITSEAIIEFGDSAEPRIYVPGQFKVLGDIDCSHL